MSGHQNQASTDTLEDFAGLDFAAYALDGPVKTPNEWAARFASSAMAMHVADRTLRMTKPELIAFIRDAGERLPETPEIMFRSLDTSQETLEGWSNLLGLARARYIVAASAACLGSDAGDKAEAKLPETEASAPAEDAFPPAPADLADACLWAVRYRSWIHKMAQRSPMTDAELDVEIAKVDAVISRAIAEPSTTSREVAAKAALAVEDYERFTFVPGTKRDDGELIVHTVLREVIKLCG